MTLALAAGICAWVIVEIAFSLHGWPGLGRYMFEPAGVLVALAGAGIGALLVEGRRISRVAGWAGIGLAAVIVLALVPPAVTRARSEHRDIRGQRLRTAEIGKLTGDDFASGRRGAIQAVRRAADAPRVPDDPGLEPPRERRHRRLQVRPAIHGGRPIVLFTPVSTGGWRVQALHQQRLGARRSR